MNRIARLALLALALTFGAARAAQADLLFVDGFDHYATGDVLTKWTAQATGNGSQTIGAFGRNSTNGLRVVAASTGSTFLAKTVASGGNANAFIIGFGHSPTLSTQNDLVAVYDGATKHIILRLNTSGELSVLRSPSTVLGTGSAALTSGTYYFIELKVVISDTVGTVDVSVNGASVLSLTSQDTRNGGNASWTGFRLCDNNALGQITLGDFDDLYVADNSGSSNNDLLGPIRIATILPDGAGASSDFTPSTGVDNYAMVDEPSTDGDSTYVSSSTPGDHDTYTFAAVGLTGTVKGVQTNLMVRSAGAGSETIRPKVRIGGADYNGTTVGITTSFVDSREIFQVSPATASAWTVSEIDGAEFGVELVN